MYLYRCGDIGAASEAARQAGPGLADIHVTIMYLYRYGHIGAASEAARQAGPGLADIQ